MKAFPDENITQTFVSTRGAPDRDFWDSVITGVDEKGGLLMPENQLQFSDDFLKTLPNLSVDEISSNVLRHFIPRDCIEDNRLVEMMQIAHDFDLPLETLNNNTFVLRLDQGPTASFKDVAARALAQLMEAHCEKYDKQLNLVVATSGDTGVAIADAFGGSKRVTVTVLYPADGVSPPQEKQMLDTNNKYENVQVLPMEGNFDNCQDISKTLQMVKNLEKFDELERGEEVLKIIDNIQLKFKNSIDELSLVIDEGYISEIRKVLRDIDLGSANSISWWRLAPQIVQYAVGIGKALASRYIEEGESVIYGVPSGNVGHLTAGLVAMDGGLPIKKFVVGTNANNVLKGLINEGVIRHPGFQPTSSPSMDIGDPNNYERILFFAEKKMKEKSKLQQQKFNEDANTAGGGLMMLPVHAKRHIEYARMKNDITRLDNEVQSLRKNIETMEKKNCSIETIDEKRRKLQVLLNKTLHLRDYGVDQEMIDYLQEIITVEDVATDEETYAAMSLTAQKTGLVMEPHGITAKIATDRVRAKGLIGEKDKVIILETAHPDKFPEALEAAGLSKEKNETLCVDVNLTTSVRNHLREVDENKAVYQLHYELSALESVKIEDMHKPTPLALNVFDVAKKIRDLSVLNRSKNG